MKMMQDEKGRKTFVGYEYKKITVKRESASMYLDCYKNFGWIADENISGENLISVEMKRDRKLINRVELTRLQQHFEACAKEIETLEKSKILIASLCAITIGIIGTVFMAGSTFAVTHNPPIIWLCVILAVPGFIGWVLPYFLYHFLIRRRSKIVLPLIEAKWEEIYEICEKGHSLL